MFVDENNAPEFCFEEFGEKIDISKLQYLINIGLLPIYKSNNKNLVLSGDLFSLLNAFRILKEKNIAKPWYEKAFQKDAIQINSTTTIDLLHEDSPRTPTFYSAVRNLISEHNFLHGQGNKKHLSALYFPENRLTTVSNKVFNYANDQLIRAKSVNIDATSQFARSAHYMGSKRSLCGFIVEAISPVLPASGIVIDLMCGSGVVSGAFSKIWQTFSSDAQKFCQALAVIHGGGFNQKKAERVVSKILPKAKKHFGDLSKYLNDSVETEDDLFCRDISGALLDEYRLFMRSFPTLSNNLKLTHWNPQKEVKNRNQNPSLYPYCLFTTYFSNVYFGLRQCVEIDSLRYAIGQLKNKRDRDWAMGALIATVSSLGTTYGGHFAQPKVRNHEEITLTKLSKIIDVRSLSITHEFTVRLLNLSEQSEKSIRHIETIPGPWENALLGLEGKVKDNPVLVYLDAPYKREEYSRYYHVLETLVTYNYPTCTGIGLTPKPGDRFRSEFFTKTESRINETLVNIITSIIQRGWTCAWSYSDSGAGNIIKIIESVYDKTFCDIKSYSVPFVHKSQGGYKPKSVTEYLIIFSGDNDGKD